MKVVSCQEMRDIELQAKEKFCLDEELIIENVGTEGSRYLHEKFLTDKTYGELVFFIGKGNNGADGLAIARHLKSYDYSIRAFLLFSKEECSKHLQTQIQMAKAYGIKLSEVSDTEQIISYFTQTQREFFVIDAITGTGIRLPLPNIMYELFNIINQYSDVIISVDTPSGLAGDTGEIGSSCIKSDYTLTIGLPKLGHYLGKGPEYSGKIRVLKSGFPDELLESGNTVLLTPDNVVGLIRPRSKFSIKNNFGHTLLIGGSKGLTGALLLSSMAALRMGAGLVTAVTWKENYNELVYRCPPEIMTGEIEGDNEEEIRRWVESKDINRYDSVVIGPGLGRGDRARSLVLNVLNSFHGPLVVDADAINVLKATSDADTIAKRAYPTIFTPHLNEFARFSGQDYKKIQEHPIGHLKQLIDRIKAAVLLKGACSYLGLPRGDIFINNYPNDGMATGGSGDVLAGMIGGLFAQLKSIVSEVGSVKSEFYQLYHSVCLSIVVHSMAGNYAAKKLGARSMSARSILDNLSTAFIELEKINKSRSKRNRDTLT